MASITLRATKGSPLTNTEVDTNFTNLNNGKVETTGASPTFVNVTVSGDIVVNGGDITTSATTFNLVNTPTTLNLGQAATIISIGATTGTTTIRNAVAVSGALGVTGATTLSSTLAVTSAATLSSTLAVTGNTTLTGDLAVNGNDITTTATTGAFNLVNANIPTINFGGAATAINMGAATGTLTVNNATLSAKAITASTSLAVNGASGITTTQTTFPLVNTTATTINFGGGAATINMGAASGALVLPATYTIGFASTTATTLNIATAATAATKTLNIGTGGANGSTTNINLGSSVTGAGGTTTINSASLVVNSGTVVGSSTTQNLFNTTATTLNIGGAAIAITIGAVTGTTTIRNAVSAPSITLTTTPLAKSSGGTGVSVNTRQIAQIVYTNFSNVATTTTLIPNDNTIPQITEGGEFMTIAFTPTTANSLLEIEVHAMLSPSIAAWVATALFVDTTPNAIAAVTNYQTTVTGGEMTMLKSHIVSGSTTTRTYRVRSGLQAAGTLTFNGQSAARLFGGVMGSYIKVTEYLA